MTDLQFEYLIKALFVIAINFKNTKEEIVMLEEQSTALLNRYSSEKHKRMNQSASL